jgi:microcystin-dependent protein
MDPFIGQILAFGFNFAPRGWAQCQGQLLPINTNTALFSLTTFALPDFRGRTMLGVGQGPGLSDYALGQQGGVENTTLTQASLPAHTHIATAQPHTHAATATSTLYAERIAGTVANPTGNMLAGAANVYVAPAPPNNVALDAGSIASTVTVAPATDSVTIGVAGNSAPFSTLSPYLCVTICIATEGIFPSRN